MNQKVSKIVKKGIKRYQNYDYSTKKADKIGNFAKTGAGNET